MSPYLLLIKKHLNCSNLIVFPLFFAIFSLSSTIALAQSCSGNLTCYRGEVVINTPDGCSEGGCGRTDPNCTECTGTRTEYNSPINLSCDNDCEPPTAPGTCKKQVSSCTQVYVPRPSATPPTSPPPTGSSCSGQCAGPAADCGAAMGGQPASGTCSDGLLCCQHTTGGPACKTLEQTCGSSLETCCGADTDNTIRCADIDDGRGLRCKDCDSPAMIRHYCGSDNQNWCGQTYICGDGRFFCPETQLDRVPSAPTNLFPADEADAGRNLCNLNCAAYGDYSCGAYLIEAKAEPGNVHFDGITESGTTYNQSNARFGYRSKTWSNISTGIPAPTNNGKRATEDKATFYFTTLFPNIRFHYGRSYYGGNMEIYSNGTQVGTINNETSTCVGGGNCSSIEWGRAQTVSVGSSRKQFSCYQDQCRLDSSKTDDTCGDDDTQVVKLTWQNANTNQDYVTYQLQIFPEGTSCSDPNAVCQKVYANNYTLFLAPGVTRYTWRVRTINDLCGTSATKSTNGAWSPYQQFNIGSEISGRFYLDTNNDAQLVGGICTSPTATLINPGTGATINAEVLDGSNVAGTISGGSFSISAPYWPSGSGGNNIVTLTPGSQYECACPTGTGSCQYSGIASPQSEVNFYLRQVATATSGWWQIFGGSSYAGGESGLALYSGIPTTTCTGANSCVPAINAADLNETADSAGISMTGGGEIDSTKDAGYQTTNVSQRVTQAFVVGTTSTKFKETYDYFYRQYSLGSTPEANDDFATTADDAPKPTSAPTGEKRAYFHQGNLTIQQAWNVQAADPINSIVVFIDGDLTITDPNGLGQLITVEPGAFLSFIVSGNIIIDDTVGNSTLGSNTANIEGVYIADGTMQVQSRGAAAGGDLTFVGAGSFVGWQGVQLSRDYSSDSDALRAANNNAQAVERFIYRPDLLINIPERMAASRYVWQETN